LLTPSARVKVSPSALGYLLVGLGSVMASMLPSTLVGVPGPGGYVLTNYQVIRDVPVAPLLGVAVGCLTIWSVRRRSSAQEALMLLSAGFIFTAGLFWVSASVPGTYVKGFGFPLSWMLLLELPLRPAQLLGTSVIAFILDWVMWTLFVDSSRFALERRRMRRDLDRTKRPN